MGFVGDYFKRLTFQKGLRAAIDPLGIFGDGEDGQPQAPRFQLPAAIQGLDQETVDLIRSQVGSQAGIPQELDIASQALQGLVGFQPSREPFQLPIQDIQAALQAQQDIQKQQFLQELRPVAAAQGQLESTGFTNQLANFLQGQQAQSLGTTADLLTQQALQDLAFQQQLQTFTPQFQAQTAGQLAGLGGQRSGIEQFNLQLPFQTTIPAFQNAQQIGLDQASREFSASLIPFQQQQQAFQQQQAQQSALLRGLGGLAVGAATGGLGFLPGISAGFGSALAGGLGGAGQLFGGGGGGFGGFGQTPQIPFNTGSPFGATTGGGANAFRSQFPVSQFRGSSVPQLRF